MSLKRQIKKSIVKALQIAVVAGTITAGLGTNHTVHADSTEGFPGTWSGKYNTLNLAPSMRGDLLFGYNNGCVYGEFSHVALVSNGSISTNGVWDGPTIESTVWSGMDPNKSVRSTTKQSRFHKYDRASLDYFSKSGYSFSSSSIVSNASGYQGAYDVTESYTSNSAWYCSKLVSRAFYDYNSYNLGFLVWGKLITPSDVWYDSAVHERTASYSSAWINPYSQLSASTVESNSKTKSSTVKYKGYEVKAKKFDSETKKLVDQRIEEEIAAGKGNIENKGVIFSDEKEGLDQYLSGLIKEGKASKEQVKEKWNLDDAEMAALN